MILIWYTKIKKIPAFLLPESDDLDLPAKTQSGRNLLKLLFLAFVVGVGV